MDRVLERCAGLDVHKKTVTACVRVPGASGDRAQHVRTFGTTTAELLMLREWLEAHRVTHVAMESTGVYWRPVFYVLEETFTCILSAGWRAPSSRSAGRLILVGRRLSLRGVFLHAAARVRWRSRLASMSAPCPR
jgi:Transposase